MYGEIKENKGLFRANLWNAKRICKNIFRKSAIISGTTFMLGTAEIIGVTNDIYEYNKNEYEEEINKYNEKISNYANEVKKLNLSDIQIFMKTMDDMWKNIEGYGSPEKDVRFFEELDFLENGNVGVCRNMSMDIAKKLNEINPKYNAKTIPVFIEKDGEYNIANIERTIIESNETVAQQNNEEKTNELAKNVLGNHMVTIVEIPEENVTLILDPTNPGIGVYINGKIIMFNSGKENGLKFEAKEYSDILIRRGGTETVKDYIESYIKPSLSMEELEEKYGLEAQNRALNEVRAIEIVNNNINQDNEFLSRLRVTDMNEQRISNEEVGIKHDTKEIKDIEER